jgi:hypothetical protein
LRIALPVIFVIAVSLSAELAPDRAQTHDEKALLSLEDQWLRARDVASLDRILASDFVHIAPGGYVLTKAEHIAWFEKHIPPANRTVRLDKLRVRIYGNTSIVNGFVVNSDLRGTEEQRTAFTDVFVFRDGRWQAVNAQENPVDSPR